MEREGGERERQLAEELLWTWVRAGRAYPQGQYLRPNQLFQALISDA